MLYFLTEWGEAVNSLCYYGYNDESSDGFNMCSRYSVAMPIEVNCTGLISIARPFRTHNERGREDYYLMYIIEGELSVSLPQGDVTVMAGDFIVFPPKYKYIYTFSGEGTISYYYAHFTGSYVDSLLDTLGITSLPYVSSAGTIRTVSDAFSTMFGYYARNEEHLSQKSGAQLQIILSSLASNRDGRMERLRSSLSYINASYTSEISVPYLAAMDNLSVSRYNVLFREQMGVSPVKYITDLRMKHACTLLLGTDMSVGTVGESVGYPDKYFFSKTFKGHMGLSPKEYRQKNKGG